MLPNRFSLLVATLAVSAACASAPPKKPVNTAASDNQKMASILQMEDQRVLRVPAPAPPPVAATSKKKQAAPPAPPDLLKLLVDPEPRIRRRAALAVGRVGLPDGVEPLQSTLTDTDPDVRQMAAFAVGLLADKRAVPALTTALQDQEPRVRGRAAEALGLIGDASAANAVGQMVAAYIKQGAIASLAPDDEQFPGTAEADAVRLGLFALVRLKTWDPLAAAVLDPSGRPVSRWWPIAYALQRINDPRALPALKQLAQGTGHYTIAFAARGLGSVPDPSSVPVLTRVLTDAKGQVPVTVSAIRALAQIGGKPAAAAVLHTLTADNVDPNVALEAVEALGRLKSTEALPYIQNLMTDKWTTMRAAATRAAARIDPDGFLITLSGMDVDANWIARGALADVLGTLSPEMATPRLKAMLNDADRRVFPSVLSALVKLKAPDIDQIALSALKDADFGVRAAAAEAVGTLKISGGAAALRDAYKGGEGDATYTARGAALDALVKYGAAEATATLRSALADKDWAIRVHAADLLKSLDPSATDVQAAIRPVPNPPIAPYATANLIGPPYSPHVYIETSKGTIEIELAVLDAPQTAQNFMALARKGFFNGLQIHRVVPNFVVQDGDPRGDGSGGPGYTIRDELNDRPFLRGTVGMALDWRDTGGSQFFITHSPQPHLDAKYTVFGHVVNGMDVVDRLQQLDTIQRVRVWDGKEPMGEFR
jgi:cyclophilin family peptidyl-prolyl cis-trans isomerase/HEAT repeat protein